MKKLILTLALFSFCNCLYAEDSTSITTSEPKPRYSHGSDGFGIMISGGIILTIGGVATRPDKYHIGNGVFQTKPFHKQGARASAIVCGISLTATGLISAIINTSKR